MAVLFIKANGGYEKEETYNNKERTCAGCSPFGPRDPFPLNLEFQDWDKHHL